MKVKFSAIFLLTIFMFASCSDDESATLIVDNFDIKLSARPNANLSLGIISTTSNLVDINFTIVDQTFENALIVDQNTGEILVNDANKFDINETELIAAEVEVLAGDLIQFSNITVNLELPEVTINYFKEIALGFEVGNSTEITRKWGSTMRVYLDGTPSSTLITKVEQTITDINELATDGFSVEIVENASLSNCYIFFGTASEFIELFPNAEAEIGSNLAIFNVWFNNNVINEARIFIDTDRPTLILQRSLILEEITQVLGLGKDSPRFPSSIFYETSRNGGFVTEYANIDRELVRLLYHPDMIVGLNSNQTDTSLRSILKSEW